MHGLLWTQSDEILNIKFMHVFNIRQFMHVFNIRQRLTKQMHNKVFKLWFHLLSGKNYPNLPVTD